MEYTNKQQGSSISISVINKLAYWVIPAYLQETPSLRASLTATYEIHIEIYRTVECLKIMIGGK